MSLDVDTVRRAIAGLKEFAETNGIMSFEGLPELLAETWWRTGDHAGHNDWDILADEVKQSWTMLAQMALREIETGDPTPES